MSVKIRLSRGGAKKRPYYYVVAQPPPARIGRYASGRLFNPMLQKDDENRVVDLERCKYWLAVGALPTDRLACSMPPV
jgi:small subunit ribosomal protein S16